MRNNKLMRLFFILFCFCAFLNFSFAQNNKSEVLLHYWHFNNLPDNILNIVETDFSANENGRIQYIGYGGGYMDRVNDGTDLNAETGFEGAYALRVRNPSNLRDLIITMPTTGFENINLSYAVKRTTNGQTLQTIYYSTSETHQWTLFESNISITEDYDLIDLDFSQITEVNNNDYFAIKIVFGGETISGTDGNNRFDNIKLIGSQIDETDIPPYISDIIELQKLIELGNNKIINLSNYFAGGENNLQFSSLSSENEFVETEIEENNLILIALKKGDAYITVYADDGINPLVSQTFRVLVYPQAHILSQSDYSFTEWSSEKQDYEYPNNMIFLQTNTSDPDLYFELLFPYFVPHDDYNDDDIPSIGYPYNNTRRTRINGLNYDGISFINTGRDRDLGGALVSLNTKNVQSAYINWKGSTILANERIYGIRLQYRIGTEGNFTDFVFEDNPIEYISLYNGHFKNFIDIEMPEDLLGQEYVQILWKYYWISGNSGPRAELGLDNIYIKKTTTNKVISKNNDKVNIYPNPANMYVNIDTDKQTINKIYNSIGQKVIKTNTRKIDISNLCSGIYTVLIINNNNEIIGNEKLVIN